MPREEEAWEQRCGSTAAPPRPLRAVECNIVHAIISLMHGADYDIRKEAVWCISNATSGGSPDQLAFLVRCGCIPPLVDVLTLEHDAKMVTVALEGAWRACMRQGERRRASSALRCCCCCDVAQALRTSSSRATSSSASVTCRVLSTHTSRCVCVCVWRRRRMQGRAGKNEEDATDTAPPLTLPLLPLATPRCAPTRASRGTSRCCCRAPTRRSWRSPARSS